MQNIKRSRRETHGFLKYLENKKKDFYCNFIKHDEE